MRGLRSLAVLISLLVTACGSCDKRAEEGDGEDQGEEREQGEDDASLGTLKGVVRLKEGAEPPQYRPTDLGRGPGRPETPEGCPPLEKSDMQPVALAGDRGASNVLVSVTEFEEAPPHEPKQHRVHITDCRLTPAVVAATRGDEIVIENESEYPFLPTLGKSPFMQSLMKGQSRTMKLSSGGVQSVTCGFAATCGRTDVIVQYHSVHGVTGDDGRFELTNVPSGEVVVHAWHPLLQEAKKTVAVTEDGTATVELVLEPAERPEPAPAEGDGGAGSGDGGTAQANQGGDIPTPQ